MVGRGSVKHIFMDSKIILGRILQKFIDQGYSQYLTYNQFGFVKHSDSSVVVTREKGSNTPLPFSIILIAIKAYQENTNLYDEGPTALRDFKITHITSPVHSLLHLLPKEAYIV